MANTNGRLEGYSGNYSIKPGYHGSNYLVDRIYPEFASGAYSRLSGYGRSCYETCWVCGEKTVIVFEESENLSLINNFLLGCTDKYQISRYHRNDKDKYKCSMLGAFINHGNRKKYKDGGDMFEIDLAWAMGVPLRRPKKDFDLHGQERFIESEWLVHSALRSYVDFIGRLYIRGRSSAVGHDIVNGLLNVVKKVRKEWHSFQGEYSEAAVAAEMHKYIVCLQKYKKDGGYSNLLRLREMIEDEIGVNEDTGCHYYEHDTYSSRATA